MKSFGVCRILYEELVKSIKNPIIPIESLLSKTQDTVMSNRHNHEHDEFPSITITFRGFNMSTLEDQVSQILTQVTALTNAGVKVDLSAVLAAETGIQNTANAILAQTQPTPTPLTAVVSGVQPTSGGIAGGQPFTITGSNFTGATGVLVGMVAATSVVVVNDTTITFNSPVLAAGVYDVIVVDAAGSSAVNTNATLTLA